MKNRICVIFTGGTIGSCSKGGTVGLKNEHKSALIEKYTARYGQSVQFDELRPLNILSENVQPSDLEKMADCVRGVDTDKYDGIILTHGTDTLYGKPFQSDFLRFARAACVCFRLISA